MNVMKQSALLLVKQTTLEIDLFPLPLHISGELITRTSCLIIHLNTKWYRKASLAIITVRGSKPHITAVQYHHKLLLVSFSRIKPGEMLWFSLRYFCFDDERRQLSAPACEAAWVSCFECFFCHLNPEERCEVMCRVRPRKPFPFTFRHRVSLYCMHVPCVCSWVFSVGVFKTTFIGADAQCCRKWNRITKGWHFRLDCLLSVVTHEIQNQMRAIFHY